MAYLAFEKMRLINKQRFEKDKDFQPFNCMLRLIRRFDGLRIYRFVAHEKTQ